MKNPGCLNNRGSPLSTSGNPSYQILRSPNAPAAMTLKAKTAYGDDIDPPSHRPVFKKLRFPVRADTNTQHQGSPQNINQDPKAPLWTDLPTRSCSRPVAFTLR